MANYFTSANDAAYLDATTAARDDLALLRTEAEAIVISNYRRTVPDTRYTATAAMGADVLQTGLENLSSTTGSSKVYLNYYEVDADDVGATADEVIFLDAMRREIAGVIRHLASQRPDGGASERPIKSETRGRRSVTYADAAVAAGEVPTNFGRWLKPFDTREKVYAL